MNYILFDDPVNWKNLLPLTFTRPVSGLRVGILTLEEKWNHYLNTRCSFKTTDYLASKFSEIRADENTYINGGILPNEKIVKDIKNLKVNQALVCKEDVLAIRVQGQQNIDISNMDQFELMQHDMEVSKIKYPWDVFIKNGEEIKADINILFKDKKSQKLSRTNNLLGEDNIYVEEGVKAEYVTINATTGPIFLGKDSEVMEGAVVRGPLALCEHSVLKLSAKVYGPVTIGPFSKVGGEISESVILGYSNKAHDGFLGNAVIGEWCNLGADTNNSNLKNNYEEVRLWNYNEERFVKTGLQFCGLIMGDHSKCGINTMFNTGTVVGVSANIFGSGFPRNFIPSFSWGGAQGFTVFNKDKAFDVAKKVMARRNKEFDSREDEVMERIFNDTGKYRRF